MTSDDDIVESLLLTPAGMALMTLGGWLDFTSTYKGLLFGFRYGLNDCELRSNVTSRKSITFLFASTVTFRPFSPNILPISFFALSQFLGVSCNTAMPSSL